MTGSLNRRLRVTGVAVLALMTGFGGLAGLTAPASAAPTTRYVATNGNDSDNDCTDSTKPCQHVQYAVDQAGAGDTVVIAKGEYQESVHIRKSLTLVGAGSTGSGKTVIDGDHKGGVSVNVDGLDVNETVAVTIKDVAVDGNPDDDGIDVEGDATLDLVDSSSSDNSGAGISSSIERGLAAAKVVSAGTVTVTRSNVSHNGDAGITAGGAPVFIDHSMVNGNSDFGLGFFATTAQVSTSTFDGNVGAGIATEGTGTLTLRTSTVSNTTESNGEGAFGAGILGSGSTLDIANSTIAGNAGAGVLNIGGQATVSTSTISGTQPTDDRFPDGGLVTVAQPNNDRVNAAIARHAGVKEAPAAKRVPAAPATSVVGSIVAEQGSKVADCAGNTTDGGDNLSSDADNSCKFSAANHDKVTTDPLLGALANNGGPTMTEILKKLSPAIDAIPAGSANCSTSATDQRGVARPQPTGGKCDVGAVELAAKKLAIHPNSLPNGKVGKAYHATITATGGQYPIYTFAFVSGSLPDGLTLSAHGKISGKPTKVGTFHFTVSVNDPVFKDYTIVITDNGSGSEPVSNTGVHTGSMLAVGGGAVLAGLLLLLWVGVLDRRARGPRIVYGRHHKK